MLHEAFHQVLLRRIYGLEEDIGTRQSLICKWDDLSYF